MAVAAKEEFFFMFFCLRDNSESSLLHLWRTEESSLLDLDRLSWSLESAWAGLGGSLLFVTLCTSEGQIFFLSSNIKLYTHADTQSTQTLIMICNLLDCCGGMGLVLFTLIFLTSGYGGGGPP